MHGEPKPAKPQWFSPHTRMQSKYQEMVTTKQRRFCQALQAETGDRSRWTLIMAVAKRLDMDGREAVLLAAECAAAELVRLDVKGPPYRLLPTFAILSGEGWKLITTPKAKTRTSSASGATKGRKRRR